MSRLYCSMTSDAIKTIKTCRGHKNARSHIRGWNDGIEVFAIAQEGKLVFEVWKTSGSNGGEKSLVYSFEVSE